MGLDVTRFVMEVEDALDVEIPDCDWHEFDTVGPMCEYILRKKPGSDYNDILQTIRRVAVHEFAVYPEEIQPGTRWIEDLRLY
jgi:acyl carrier protein